MLDFLRGKASERKLRLFACTCSRRVWHVLNEARRAAVEVAERYADGQAGEAERAAAYEAAGGGWSALYTQADCVPAKALVTGDLGYFIRDASASVLNVADEQGRYILPVEPGRAKETAGGARSRPTATGGRQPPVPGHRARLHVDLHRQEVVRLLAVPLHRP